jgi:hypothetical protein
MKFWLGRLNQIPETSSVIDHRHAATSTPYETRPRSVYRLHSRLNGGTNSARICRRERRPGHSFSQTLTGVHPSNVQNRADEWHSPRRTGRFDSQGSNTIAGMRRRWWITIAVVVVLAISGVVVAVGLRRVLDLYRSGTEASSPLFGAASPDTI